MVRERICLKVFDWFRTAEDGDLDVRGGFTRVEMAPFNAHILRSVHFRSLFAAVEQNTSRSAGAGAGGIHLHVRLEMRPQHVVRDLLPSQKGSEVLYSRPVGGFRVVHQEISMLSTQVLGVAYGSVSANFQFLTDMEKNIPFRLQHVSHRDFGRTEDSSRRCGVGEGDAADVAADVAQYITQKRGFDVDVGSGFPSSSFLSSIVSSRGRPVNGETHRSCPGRRTRTCRIHCR